MAKCKQTFPSAREVIDNVVCNEFKREREKERGMGKRKRGARGRADRATT